MNKVLHYLKIPFLLCCFISFTSCFEILEEINLKSDGSGEAIFTVNMSQSKTKLASIMLMDSINGYKVPDKEEISDAMNKILSHLKSSPGISNIKKTADYKNFIFAISCSFSKIEDINDVALNAQKKYKSKDISEQDTKGYTFNRKSNIFTRFYNYNPKVKKEFAKLKSEDKKVIDDATYTCIYRFDKPVVSKDNKNARLSKSKKAVMLRAAIIDLISGNIVLNNKIKLTP